MNAKKIADTCDLTEKILRKKSQVIKLKNLCGCMDSAEVCVLTSSLNVGTSSWPVFLHSS